MVLLEYYAGTDALQYPCHFGNGIPRWKGKKDIDIVFCDLKGMDLKIVRGGDLLKDLQARSIFDISEPTPDDICCHRLHGWFCSVPCSRYSIFIPAFGRRTFHPRSQKRVFKFWVCIKHLDSQFPLSSLVHYNSSRCYRYQN
jgi:hypothetical protein